MLNIAKDADPVVATVTPKKLRLKPKLEIVVTADLSGDRPALSLLFHNRDFKSGPAGDMDTIELDTCLPWKCSPEATVASAFLWKQRSDVEDREVFEEVISNIVARTASVKLVYDRLENGVDIQLKLGTFKAEAFMDREKAERYFLLPEEE